MTTKTLADLTIDCVFVCCCLGDSNLKLGLFIMYFGLENYEMNYDTVYYDALL
jgi:hypothetical protein